MYFYLSRTFNVMQYYCCVGTFNYGSVLRDYPNTALPSLIAGGWLRGGLQALHSNLHLSCMVFVFVVNILLKTCSS